MSATPPSAKRRRDEIGRTVRLWLLTVRDLLLSAGPLALVPALLLALAYWWLDPTPPKQVRLATGPAQSAYADFGQRYAEALKASGITVELIETAGTSDNLRLLREGDADVAFVRGGTADAVADDEELTSLGSLFVEPLWLFYREAAARNRPDAVLAGLHDLRRLRVNADTAGSGVPALLARLLDINRMAPGDLRLSHLAHTPATVEFLAGRLDVLVFVSAPESPLVQMLLQTPGVKLMDFGQSEAYARRLPFLSPVTLPRGVVDIASDVPARDVELLAATTSLLSRKDTHPALRQLFAQSAQPIHGGAGWFNRPRDFPNTRTSELPVSAEGERAINGTPPFWQRYLPFWMANLVERMWLVLGLVLAAMLPLSRIVPPLYAFRVRSRVFRWYGRLREIEARADAGEADRDALLADLAELDRVVHKVAVPLSYTEELYALRNNIHAVRKRVMSFAQPPSRPDAGG
jgi:TRAP-type uncharacterized transport system substrate-binding protein